MSLRPASLIRTAVFGLTLAGCGGGVYGRVRDLVGPSLPSRIPPLPSPESMAGQCPAGTSYIVNDFDGNDRMDFERFCAGEDGHVEGPFLKGDYVSASLRLTTGRMHQGRADGRWFAFDGTPATNKWCESHHAAGHPVGHLRGEWYGKRTEGDYDDQGRMNGRWLIDDEPFQFEYGTGHVGWYDVVANGKVTGQCEGGLRVGPWQVLRDATAAFLEVKPEQRCPAPRVLWLGDGLIPARAGGLPVHRWPSP